MFKIRERFIYHLIFSLFGNITSVVLGVDLIYQMQKSQEVSLNVALYIYLVFQRTICLVQVSPIVNTEWRITTGISPAQCNMSQVTLINKTLSIFITCLRAVSLDNLS